MWTFKTTFRAMTRVILSAAAMLLFAAAPAWTDAIYTVTLNTSSLPAVGYSLFFNSPMVVEPTTPTTLRH